MADLSEDNAEIHAGDLPLSNDLPSHDSDTPHSSNRNLPLDERVALFKREVFEESTQIGARKLQGEKISTETLERVMEKIQMVLEAAMAGSNEEIQCLINDMDLLEMILSPATGYSTRRRAAESLQGTKFRQVLMALCEIGLRYDDDDVSEAAAIALIGTTDQETRQWICNVGLRDPEVCVRHVSVWALQDTPDPACQNALCEIGLRDMHEAVRTASAGALRGTMVAASLRALCELGLQDEVSDVRETAADSLSHLKDDPEIGKALRDAGF